MILTEAGSPLLLFDLADNGRVPALADTFFADLSFCPNGHTLTFLNQIIAIAELSL